MDNFNFVSDGEKKLPPGFRFQPTDEEIVFQYLARKTFSHPLPAHVIPELNIFSFDPWELFPGNSDEEDKYFFCNKEANNGNGNQTGKAATCSGYWKDSGTTKQIICSKSMPILGIKKTLVFYKGKNKEYPRGFRTDWIMHEYCISVSENSACNYNLQQKNNSLQDSLVRIGNWTLCRIFSKKMIISATEVDDNNMPRNFDFMSDTDSSSASSSSPHCDSTIY